MTNTTGWLSTLTEILTQDYAVAFVSLAFMLKCLLISFYCFLIYLAIRFVKRIWGGKMSVRANYYSWYALLLCFPLSGLGFNTALKLPFYDLFSGSFSFYTAEPYNVQAMNRFVATVTLLRSLLLVVTLIWLAVVLVKCLRQIAANIWLQRNIGHQNDYDDQIGLKQKAAAAFGLHPGKIRVVAADFVRSPVSYGVFGKTILFPDDYKSRYTLSEQYLLLLHEMGHIKNRDTVKIQLLDVAACFIWPVHLIKKHFIRDSEVLCDNRVLGIRQGEQDAYSELIVQECAVQRKVKGLGFSNSYQTIKSRLDAIYSHGPEKHRLAVFSVAIMIILAVSSVYASQYRAEWLKTATEEEPIFFEEGKFRVTAQYIEPDSGDIVDCNAYNLHLGAGAEGEQVEYSEDKLKQAAEYQALRSTYSYSDGQLRVDKVALYAYLRPYIEEGFPVTRVSFTMPAPHYISTERKDMLWGEAAGWILEYFRIYTLDLSELEQANEENRYANFNTSCVTRDELIYLFAAHWL